ncbi:kinase-like protein [Chiua virens]|nr:kinase-like protein [Chiua virens]
MSEPELAYMNNANDDFDLPRWQTQAHLEPLSSSAQAAQAAARASYLYPAAPPPPPQSLVPVNTQPRAHHSPGSSRQPRIAHLLDQDSPSTFFSGALNQLSRSASLGATASVAGTSRTRRHHQPDDLEGAFNVDTQSSTARPSQQQPASALYPSSVPFHQPTTAPTNPVSTTAPEPYSDMYYNGTAGNLPKRSLTQHDPTTRSGRSPMRTGNSLLDPYQQQAQYSPTTTPSYLYGPSSEAQRGSTAPNYPSHTRSHSQTKLDGSTPPVGTPFSPQSVAQAAYAGYAMESSSPQPQSHQNQSHLSPQAPPKNSTSTPSTPLSFAPSQTPANQFYPQDQPMLVDPSPQHRRRASGFRRVRDGRDLRPYVNNHPTGRRIDANGIILSPLRQLTTNIVDTYHICNPQFRYESAHNPRRVLTKPSKPAHNDGYDNEDYDYILYVNDWLGSEDGHNRYLILDILGQGTFGQVVKCQNMKTNEIVAVKVVKNKPAYFNQSMMEVTILELLNNQCDPGDEHHILRLRDSFIHRNHLCLVFELLSSNLYELIKQNQFQGLSTQLVKVFTAQLLDALTVLKDARLIHCDLKPENILLKSLQSPQIKVIDFGSACHERQTVYTYIQSRFYRSPEVILGIPYTSSIDMWSLGCIAVELFLGLPLFPGTSEYNQITRIVEMLGMPPAYMLDMGKQTKQFFDSYVDVFGHKKYRLKTLEQYSREHNTNEQPGKQYFKATTLPEIINTAPMPTFKSSTRQGHEMEKELNNRASFIDFCQGLLNLNPIERWSPQQARMHPFITGEKFTKPFQPNGHSPQISSSSGSSADPKRPYGGLVPSQPKGTRAFQDAASYNQHLAQHQAYTAQAQAASQAANNVFRNPYISGQQGPAGQQQTQGQPPPPPASTVYQGTTEPAPSTYQTQQGPPPPAPPQPAQHAYASQPNANAPITGQVSMGGGTSGYPPGASGLNVSGLLNPNPPTGTASSAYYPNTSHGPTHTRIRANTINHSDVIPPALARLQHMNQDVIAGRNALTPVLNRDDAMREWERRQAGKPSTAQPYPQLEYLQQQAELAAASGLGAWSTGSGGAGSGPGAGGGAGGGRYQAPPSKLSHSYQPTIIVDDESRREAVMSNVRSAARGDAGPSSGYNPSAMVTSPAQTYATGLSGGGGGTAGGGSGAAGAAGAGGRYPGSYVPQQAGNSPFDALGQRTDIGTLYVPLQPDQYQSYGGTGVVRTQGNAAAGGQGATSFYGPSVAGAQGRNPFSGGGVAETGQGGQQVGTKEGRRLSGMDIWSR